MEPDIAGQWINIDEKEKTTHLLTPEIEGEISARVSVGSKNSVKVYGIAGPYIKAMAFLQASAVTEMDYCGLDINASLDAGARVCLGFFMQIFSHTFFDFNTCWDIYTVNLGETRGPSHQTVDQSISILTQTILMLPGHFPGLATTIAAMEISC